MSNVIEIRHPLVRHHLSRLRDEQTAPVEFREALRRLSVFLAIQATGDLAEDEILIQTPLTAMTGSAIGQRVALVPILRAGLGMVEPILNLMPEAEVWHLGIYRDEATATPVEYYSKIPRTDPVDVGFVLDPMLATGGSAVAALQTLQRWGIKKIKLLSMIASLEGIQTVSQQFPTAELYVCAIDPQMNTKKYIVPGLGDAGDRQFNTLRSAE